MITYIPDVAVTSRMGRSVKEPYRQLLSLAASQGGLFTSAQAQAHGIARPQHSRYVTSGEWAREAHGIYRVSALPETDPVKSQYHLWLLWSIGRDGKNQAAFAYETALAIYSLSDLQPAKIHLSVPQRFRRSVVPKVVQLHKEERNAAKEVWDWEGLRVVRPFQTIVDLIREERVSPEHVEKGFIDGIKSGLINRDDGSSPQLSPRERRLFATWTSRGGRA